MALTTVGLATPAAAFTVSQNNDGKALLEVLLGNSQGLHDFSVNLQGHGDAFGIFNNDPFGLGAGIVLSTGKVEELPGLNESVYDLNTDFHMPGSQPGTFDLAQLDLHFYADDTVDRLFFDYVFGSEEFLEFAGSPWNDSFELLLNGVNLAQLSDGQEVNINNLAYSPTGPFHPDYIDNPVGSNTPVRLNGYTRTLTFEGRLQQNAMNTLSIRIQDVADGELDSAVFLKAGTLGTVTPATPPAEQVPEPNVILGLLMLSGMAIAGKRQQGHQDLNP
ncbi:choice-of-anchor L domain-containing protein [Phormidium yuhuli AB48]|uniref:Choice-of-anchor L domain-containing protein n=2 Tax=Phormidium TaxID=1198 RepID=A0ABY5AKW8_9CYAN|nr:choice-of-anchor L domain-containing protein [Phormidium yuhuli]USR89848.1 choice-of-anchor L domain-containing protein [Phormidium yuhuli AB48]